MNTGRAFGLAFGFILAGAALIGVSARKDISLVIDGETTSRNTFALTTGGFLQSSGITLSENDSLTPLANHWLRDGDTIEIEHAAQVIIRADGKTHRLTSYERKPANLFLQVGIPLFPGDLVISVGRRIDPEEMLPRAPVHALELRRAKQITLQNGSSTETFSSNASSLGQALWETGIAVYAEDRLSLPLDTPLQESLVVHLTPSKEITLRTASGRVKTRSAVTTVGEALAEAGQPLQGLDFSSPEVDEALPSDSTIQVVRVQEDIVLETTAMPFETQTQPVADLELDQQKVVDEGRMGLNIRRIRVRLEDGLEVSRQIEGEYTALEPQPRILGYGTKVVPHTLETPDGPIKYWRALNMYAVSYNHTSNGGTGTATGIPLAKGVAAVDINYIPFYTQMYIPGYGHAVAADVGGGVQGRMIDLGYSDSDYVSWHQWVTVYMLWPPPATIPWTIP